MKKFILIALLCFAAPCLAQVPPQPTLYSPYYLNGVNCLTYGAYEARFEIRENLIEVEMKLQVEALARGPASFDVSLPTAILPSAIVIGVGVDESSSPSAVVVVGHGGDARERLAHVYWVANEPGTRIMTLRLSYRWHY